MDREIKTQGQQLGSSRKGRRPSSTTDTEMLKKYEQSKTLQSLKKEEKKEGKSLGGRNSEGMKTRDGEGHLGHQARYRLRLVRGMFCLGAEVGMGRQSPA